MAKPFLLEIGTEEVPDWMIAPALANLRELFTKLLADNGLSGEVTRVDATPRHLVLPVELIVRDSCQAPASGLR